MSEVSELEQQRKDQKRLVDLRDKAIKLSNNREFKDLILEEFMVREAARYVQTSADPAISAEGRADALAIAQASGHLKRYLSVVVQMGNNAEHNIEGIDQALDEIRAEDGE